MNVRESFQSQPFKWLLIGLVEIILLLAAFLLGQTVGFYKTETSYRWEENYGRVFGGPRRSGLFGRGLGGMMGPGGGAFLNAHGTAGQVIKIDNNTMVIRSDNDIERTIMVATTTVIKKDGRSIKLLDIKNEDKLVTIGTPDAAGQINAKFIRVFSQP